MWEKQITSYGFGFSGYGTKRRVNNEETQSHPPDRKHIILK